MVNRSKVRWRVLTSFVHTAVSVLVMLIVMAVVVGVSARFGGTRAVIPILYSSAGISLAVFLMSEVIVCVVFRAERADPTKFPNYVESVNEICRGKWMLRPRLYVLRITLPGRDEEVPNAMAFGWGILGQYAIGISERLYHMLDREELKAVLAHEVGHIRCKDVGLMTILAIVTGGAEKLGYLFGRGGTSLGKSPFSLILSVFFYVVSRFIFPVGRAAIAQEREYSADAIAALEVNSPDPLIGALKKLQDAIPAKNPNVPDEVGVFDDLFLSHPGMEKRIAALEALRV